MRTRAAETGEYAGNDDARFEYLARTDTPSSATVTVYRFVAGQRVPFTATARMSEFKPADGADVMWRRMPHHMLGKVAEAQALRKAFPRQLAGLYAREEMAAADDDDRDPGPPRDDVKHWAEKPPTTIGETLRQALRETKGKAGPTPVPAPVVDTTATPTPTPAPLPPQTVTITGVEPARSGSPARGYLTHSGGADPLPFFSEAVELTAKAARASGAPVVLDVKLTRASKTPYVDAIKDADVPPPQPPSADDIPF